VCEQAWNSTPIGGQTSKPIDTQILLAADAGVTDEAIAASATVGGTTV
jgi:hypothetical protein